MSAKIHYMVPGLDATACGRCAPQEITYVTTWQPCIDCKHCLSSPYATGDREALAAEACRASEEALAHALKETRTWAVTVTSPSPAESEDQR